MVACAETAQLHLLPILDLLGVTVTPLERHFRVRVGIDKNVEGTVSVQHGQESHGGSDLPEDRLDLGLDLGFGLVF